MTKGKIKSAVNYLNKYTSGGVLSLQDIIQTTDESAPTTVREVLEQQHPTASEPHQTALLDEDLSNSQPFNPIIFDSLDGDMIKQAAIQCQGAAGPSGLDSSLWRRMCCSFQQASLDLCNALAAIGRRISTQSVPSEGLSAFVACRLIPLEKCP